MTIIDRCGQIGGKEPEISTYNYPFVYKSVDNVEKSYKSNLLDEFSNNSEYLDMLMEYNDK